ncbi:SMI1/KNR4 family protein [Streptomyces sp. NPDC002640]
MSEPTSAPSLLPLASFSTWAPLLRAWTEGRGAGADQVLHLAGAVGRDRVRASGGVPPHARDSAASLEAVERVRAALTAAAAESVTFSARISPSGRTRLRLSGPDASREGTSDHGALVLVEDAVPEPWRRLPEVYPEAGRPAADPAGVERWLLERLPGAAGARDEEFAAAEARLGQPLPAELRSLYRVVGTRREDWDTAMYEAVPWELLPLDKVHVADAAFRSARWQVAALRAVVTPPGAAVQGLVGSPGWIVFGEDGCGDLLAVDLTPGPGGRAGQIVALPLDEPAGAHLVADCLLDLLRGTEPHCDEPRGAEQRGGSAAGDRERDRVVARLDAWNRRGVADVAGPELEVLCVSLPDGPPADLAPLAGLPRLRTLSALPGTLADPRQIGALSGLEYLELGPAEWRTLLDAGAVPRGLAAARIITQGLDEPGPPVALSNEILALWGRPPLVRAVVDGDLGPLPQPGVPGVTRPDQPDS